MAVKINDRLRSVTRQSVNRVQEQNTIPSLGASQKKQAYSANKNMSANIGQKNSKAYSAVTKIKSTTPKKKTGWQYKEDGTKKTFDELSTPEVLTWIGTLPENERAGAARDFETNYLKNPGSTRYDPYYTDYSNNDEARALFGVNTFDQKWIDENRGYANYLTFTNESYTTPKKPGKNASAEEQAAYQWWQIANTYEKTTQAAENEYAQLRSEIQEMVQISRKAGDSLNADEILQGIDWSEYETLENLREASAAGNGRYLNRPVQVGDASLKSMINAAIRGEDVTEARDFLMDESEYLKNGTPEQKYLLTGDATKAEQTEKQDSPYADVTSAEYDPYYGTGSNNQTARELFGVDQFDQEWIDENRNLMAYVKFKDEDDTTPIKPDEDASEEEKKAYQYWLIANTYEETTRNAEEEAANLQDWMNRRAQALGDGATAEDLLSEIDWEDEDWQDEYPTLYNMLEVASAGNKRMLNRPVNAGSEGLKAMANQALGISGEEEQAEEAEESATPKTAADLVAENRAEYGLTGATNMIKQTLKYFDALESQGQLTDELKAKREEWQAEYDALQDEEAEREAIEDRVKTEAIERNYNLAGPLAWLWNRGFNDATIDGEHVPLEDYEDFLKYRANPNWADNAEEMSKYDRYSELEERASLLAEGVATGFDKAATAATGGLEYVLYTLARKSPATQGMTKDEIYASDRFLAALKGWNEQYDREYIDEETKAELVEQYPVVATISAGVSELIKMTGQIANPTGITMANPMISNATAYGVQFLQNSGKAAKTIAKLGGWAANTMPFALDVYGSTYETAISEGATEDQAAMAAAINGLGTGALSNAVVSHMSKLGGGITRIFTSRAGKTAAQQGAIMAAKNGKINAILSVGRTLMQSALEEGAEEAIEVPIEGLIAKAVYDRNRAWTGEGGVFDAQAMLESGMGGAVAGSMFTLTAGASGLMGKAAKAEADRLIDKAENGETVTSAEIEKLAEMEGREASIQDKAEEIMTADTSAVDAAEQKVQQAQEKITQTEQQLAEAQTQKEEAKAQVTPIVNSLKDGTASYQDPETVKAIGEASKQMSTAQENVSKNQNAVDQARQEYEQMLDERDQTVQQAQTAARAQAAQEVDAEIQTEKEAKAQALADEQKAEASRPDEPGVKWLTKNRHNLTSDQQTQINILDALGRKYGIEIDIVDTLGGKKNGMYGGGRRVTVALDATENAYVQVGVHEMVHYVREMDQDAYNVLEEVVFNHLSEGAYADEADSFIDELIQQRIDEYKGIQELSWEDAREEIVAEVVPQVLANEESARRLVEENKTLVQKIRDHFVKFARNLWNIAQRYTDRMKRTEIALIESNADALMEIADTLDMALELAKGAEKNEDNAEKLNLKAFSDGRRFVDVTTDQHIFDDLTPDEMRKAAAQEIRKRFVGKVIGTDNRVFVNTKGAKEYAYPAKRNKNDTVVEAKARASTELDNLMDAGMNERSEADGRDGHVHANVKGGFVYYDALFKVGHEYFEGKINVAVTDKGRLFHDVTDIKNVTQDTTRQYGSEPYAVVLRDNSIVPDSAGNVNEKFSIKADGDTAQLIEETKAEEKAEMLDDAGRIARKVVREYKSTVTRGEAASRIDEMMDAYQDHDAQKAAAIADQLAKEIVESSVKLDTSHQEGYEEIRKRLRETGLSLTDTQKQEVANRYGSYNDWRKSIMGSVMIKNAASSLDAIWGELSGMHPEYFPADANEAQMPEYIEKFVRAMKPRYSNPYGFDTAGVAADLSTRLQADVMEIMGGDMAETAAQMRQDSESLRELTRLQNEEKAESKRQKRLEQFKEISGRIKTARDSKDDKTLQAALNDYRKLMGGRSKAADAIDAGIQARQLRNEANRLTGLIGQLNEIVEGEDADYSRAKLNAEIKVYEELRDQLRRQANALHRQEVIDQTGIDAEAETSEWQMVVGAEMERRLHQDMNETISENVADMRSRIEQLGERARKTQKDYNMTSTITRQDLLDTFSDLEGEIVQHSRLAETWKQRGIAAKQQLSAENDQLQALRRERREAMERGDSAAANRASELIFESEDRKNVLTSQEKLARAQEQYCRRIGAESLDKALSEGRLPQPIMEKVIAMCKDAGRRGAFNQNVLVQAGEAIRLNSTTAARVYDDLFGEAAPLMRAIYYDQVMDNETERTRWIAGWRERIDALGLTKEQSALVQEIGERRLNEQDARYQQADQTVLDAVQVFRQFYDEAHALASRALERNGYERPGKISNYFPHMETAKTFWDKLGIPMENSGLPTSINGLTDTFTPGKQYSGHLEHRYGEKTDYDALFGFEQYISSISNVIYHTDDIQRHRQLETEIRAAAKNGAFDGGQRSEHLNEFVKWIHEYTNLLAGKKAWMDRPFEGTTGRAIYSAATRLKSIKGASAVGANVASAVTNMVPVSQIAAEHPVSMVKAAMQMMTGVSNGRNGVPESQYKIRKFGSDSVVKTMYTKVMKGASKPFEWVDLLATNLVVNTYYQNNLSMGMDSETAMRSADSKAARLMGDRSKGAMPNIYGSQMAGFVTQFQLEVANQSQHFRKDIWREKGAGKALVTLLATALTGHLWNEINEWLTGRRPAADPIQMGIDIYQTWKNDGSPMAIGQAAYNSLSEMFPYANMGGRPAAFEDVGTFIEALTTEGNDGKDVVNALGQLAYGMIPGGGQIRKSVRGGFAVNRGGYYNASGTQLRYAVPSWDENPVAVIQAIVFGPSSTQEAQSYYGDSPGLADYGMAAAAAIRGEGWTEPDRLEAPGLNKSQTENYEQARKRGATSIEAYDNEAQKAAAAKLESEASKTEKAAEEAAGRIRDGLEAEEVDTSEVEEQKAEAADLREDAMPGDLLTDFWWERRNSKAVQNGIQIWRETGDDWALPYKYTAEKSYTINGEPRYIGPDLINEVEKKYEEGYEEILGSIDLTKADEKTREEIREQLEDLYAEVNAWAKKQIKKRE